MDIDIILELQLLLLLSAIKIEHHFLLFRSNCSSDISELACLCEMEQHLLAFTICPEKVPGTRFSH